MGNIRTSIPLCHVVLFLLFVSLGMPVFAQTVRAPDSSSAMLALNLDECLATALRNNKQRSISQFAIEIAEAQHRQALSSYWPQMTVRAGATRLDDDPNFIFPGSQMQLSLGPLGQLVVPVPESDVKLMDRNVMTGSANLLYPVYTGGKRSALVNQAKIGIEAARETARLTDLEVVYDVKRYYYGTVLAGELRKLAEETHARLVVTKDLTEHLYKTGSGLVKKTDFLRTQIIVANVRSMVELMLSNEKLAKSALVNSMGVAWNSQIELKDTEIPYDSCEGDIDSFIHEMYKSNPDWTRIELGIRAAGEKIKDARSGYLPVVALTGSLVGMNNSYDKGIMTPVNKVTGIIGITMEISLFDGLRTSGRINEARASLKKLEEQKILLREGLALKMKHSFIELSRAQRQIEAQKESLAAAEENRELTIQAYQNELLETKDVIEAQLLESFTKGQYLKAIYDHAVNRAELDFVIGNELVGAAE